jgi:hypothetical protein
MDNTVLLKFDVLDLLNRIEKFVPQYTERSSRSLNLFLTKSVSFILSLIPSWADMNEISEQISSQIICLLVYYTRLNNSFEFRAAFCMVNVFLSQNTPAE